MLIYISGTESYYDYQSAELWLSKEGYHFIDPHFLVNVCPFFTEEQKMTQRYELIQMADGIFMLHDWQKVKSASAELSFAKSLGKKVIYQDYYGRNKREQSETL